MGKQHDTIADAVGMPDETDKENIRKILLKFDKKYPGFIQHARDEAKKQFEAEGGDKQKYGLVNKSAHGRILFELPEELYHSLEAYIPTIFQNDKHRKWFIKHFQELLVPEKY